VDADGAGDSGEIVSVRINVSLRHLGVIVNPVRAIFLYHVPRFKYISEPGSEPSGNHRHLFSKIENRILFLTKGRILEPGRGRVAQ